MIHILNIVSGQKWPRSELGQTLRRLHVRELHEHVRRRPCASDPCASIGRPPFAKEHLASRVAQPCVLYFVHGGGRHAVELPPQRADRDVGLNEERSADDVLAEHRRMLGQEAVQHIARVL